MKLTATYDHTPWVQLVQHPSYKVHTRSHILSPGGKKIINANNNDLITFLMHSSKSLLGCYFPPVGCPFLLSYTKLKTPLLSSSSHTFQHSCPLTRAPWLHRRPQTLAQSRLPTSPELQWPNLHWVPTGSGQAALTEWLQGFPGCSPRNPPTRVPMGIPS